MVCAESGVRGCCAFHRLSRRSHPATHSGIFGPGSGHGVSGHTRVTMTAKAQTITILFTDLVGSTELLQRTGDERAEHIFRAHHRLLSDAVEAHRGHEVKWLGDGLMVAFESVSDAVTCAI